MSCQRNEKGGDCGFKIMVLGYRERLRPVKAYVTILHPFQADSASEQPFFKIV